MKYRTGTSTYCLPACMQGGRQEGRHPERISYEFHSNLERIPNAPRPTMRAPVSTCSAVQYRTTCREAGAGRQASRTNLERIPNEFRTYPERIPSDNEGSRIYMHAGRQAGRQASRTNLEQIPNESRTNPERTPSDNEGSRIYMWCSTVPYDLPPRHPERISNESQTNLPFALTKASRHACRKACRQEGSHAGRQANMHAGRRAGRQACRQASRKERRQARRSTATDPYFVLCSYGTRTRDYTSTGLSPNARKMSTMVYTNGRRTDGIRHTAYTQIPLRDCSDVRYTVRTVVSGGRTDATPEQTKFVTVLDLYQKRLASTVLVQYGRAFHSARMALGSIVRYVQSRAEYEYCRAPGRRRIYCTRLRAPYGTSNNPRLMRWLMLAISTVPYGTVLYCTYRYGTSTVARDVYVR